MYKFFRNGYFEFDETITTPNSNCADGRVTLKFISDNELQFYWLGDDHPDNRADGLLTRK